MQYIMTCYTTGKHHSFGCSTAFIITWNHLQQPLLAFHTPTFIFNRDHVKQQKSTNDKKKNVDPVSWWCRFGKNLSNKVFIPDEYGKNVHIVLLDINRQMDTVISLLHIWDIRFRFTSIYIRLGSFTAHSEDFMAFFIYRTLDLTRVFSSGRCGMATS